MLRTMAAALGLAWAAGGAGAATVASQEQVLAASGQDLAFAFAGLPPAQGGGTVTVSTGASANNPGIDLNGDFGQLGREFFQLTFDGVPQGLFSCGGDAGVGATPIPGATGRPDFTGLPDFSDCRFSLPVTVGATDLAAFLADGVLTVGVLFSDDVSAFPALGEADVVGVSLDYDAVAPVPLPASGLLLAGAIGAGLALRRRAA